MDLSVSGAGDLVNRLSRFDREVYLVLQREIREASNVVAEDARKRLPSEKVLFGGESNGDIKSKGWGPWTHTGVQKGSITFADRTEDRSYDGERARKSIRVGARKFRRAGSYVGIVGRVTLTDPGAIMWALIGKKPEGSRFERAVMRMWPTDVYPRALGPAWTKHAPEAAEKIDEALDRAKSAIGL